VREVTDDTGAVVALPPVVSRVVSLVPSLTETVEVSAPGLLVAATAWCTHPAGLQLRRVGGTKNPDVEAVAALEPDLVLANAEENRAADLGRLRDLGLAVWVTDVRTVDSSFGSLRRMLAACGLGEPGWLREAQRVWADPPAAFAERRRALVPIWRRPWMALGHDTFAGDLLSRLGVDNVLAGAAERYPRFDVLEAPDHDLVVLPDEPYAFAADDGPEAFASSGCALVSGRHLTWYGPSLVEAADVLTRQLRAVLPAHGASSRG
jgi:ABC-type Fe3+-hydroxamate transport system substrate-binding protein